MVPVARFAHFNTPVEHEFDCLNLNVTVPPGVHDTPLPVMVWIHGGSFLFGSSATPTYDHVNLVTYSAKLGKPVIGVSINYRVGLFGFLASEAIREDLAGSGSFGAGNFGLTDQQTALLWVQKYIAAFGGDPNNVTIFGESAGGMSVAQQIWAANPAVFHRAISMSGTLNTIPVWSLKDHERRYQALLSYLAAGSDVSKEKSLAFLRSIPQEAIAGASCPIEGSFFATGNPCDDGWYHSQPPSVETISSPPSWLQSYMIGDVLDEAMIFHGAMDDQNYNSILSHLTKFMDEEKAVEILDLYEIHSELPHDQLTRRFHDMAGDGVFKLHTVVHAHASKVSQTYAYHVDQVSTLENPLKGLAYHALELLYVFMNMEEAMSEGQKQLSQAMAAHFIDFAYGEAPWKPAHGGTWMVYGPNDTWGEKSEEDDESVRQYVRMQRVREIGLFPQWMEALDHIVNKRWLLGSAPSQK